MLCYHPSQAMLCHSVSRIHFLPWTSIVGNTSIMTGYRRQLSLVTSELYICMGISINSSCVAFTKRQRKGKRSLGKVMTDSPSKTSSSTSTQKKTATSHPADRYANSKPVHRR